MLFNKGTKPNCGGFKSGTGLDLKENKKKGVVKLKFTHIRLQNFCKHKSFETDLYDLTEIKGCNEVGKSTIKRAIYWVLNLKDENGKEITGIRPHDSNGVDFEDLVTEVELTLDSGITLKKCYYMKRNKKGEPTGNVTDCYVADIPKQSGEYAKYLSELIPSDLCVNAQSFLKLDTTKRRALLEETFGQHTTDEIVDMYSEFEPIREMLKVGSIAELKKRCNDAIKGDKFHKGLKQQSDEIPARIDEVSKQKIDIDVAELELGRNAINEQLAEIKVKQDDLSKQMEEIDKASDGILELKFEVNELIRQANEENIKARREIEDKISGKKFLLKNAMQTVNDCGMDIEKEKYQLKVSSENIEKCREEFKRIQNLEFDENSLVCAYCGQEYPQEKKDELRAEFENHKTDEVKEILELGNNIKADIVKNKEIIENLEKEIIEHNESVLMLNTAITDLEKQLSELPQEIDISDREDIQALNKQIAEKEQAMKENNSFSEIRDKLEDEEANLQSDLLKIERQLAKSENNAAIDERISELQKEQREIAQKIADEEKTLNYLKEFDRKKQELLTEDVNKYFEFTQVKMFETQLNGELKDVCQLIYEGESYDRNLNHGAKILTEIDICRAFQKKLEVSQPIITDDTESLDNWRIPKVDNQVIMIRRSNDKELTVKEVSQ